MGVPQALFAVCVNAGLTFDPRDVLPRAWPEVKGEAMSVNEADYSWCTATKACVVVRRWSCPAHIGNEVSSCMGSQSALRRPEVNMFAWKTRICIARIGDDDMCGARATPKKMDSKFNTNF